MRSFISTLSLTLVCATAVTSGCSSDAGLVQDGGAAGAGGGSGLINCNAISDPIDPTALVDDMEAPDYTTVMQEGRNGAWWAGGDTEAGSAANNAEIQPNGDAPAEAIPGGRCGSMYAMRITGHGFTSWAVLSVSMGWGAVDGGAEDLRPYDASDRRGITFWARIGDTSSDRVRVAFSDKYSRPQGGICVEGGATDVACYDLFGVELTQLSTTWKPYRIPFSGLSQRAFGLPRPELDASSIYTIEFAPAPNAIFDFWVDDVNFY
jgi:hypothetical protein